MAEPPWGPTYQRKPCTCRYGPAPSVRDQGFDMGGETARIGTTPGCPEHDSCRGFTKALRALYRSGRLLFCPRHPRLGTACPTEAGDGR